MKSVTLTEFRAKLATLLDAVERGESFDLTQRGKVIARVEPFEEQLQPLPTHAVVHKKRGPRAR